MSLNFYLLQKHLLPACTPPRALSPSFLQHFQFHSVKFQFHLIASNTLDEVEDEI